MSLPYIQSTMSSVRAGGDSFISRPFLGDGDTVTKVYNMACSQLADDYDPDQLDLNDTMASAGAAGVIALPFAADYNAYYVGDSEFSPGDGGMIEFTRKFANIPATRSVLSGTENYLFPGYVAPGLVRIPFNETTPTTTEYKYYLPGVTDLISSIADIPIPSIFKIEDLTLGQWVDTLNNLGAVAGTVPSKNEYLDFVTNGDGLTIGVNLDVWLGNIIVRGERTVVAI